jgi:ABC-2 type transport system ATP-binding protein
MSNWYLLRNGQTHGPYTEEQVRQWVQAGQIAPDEKLNREGTTILLTSHNMEEVDRLCHRVAFLSEGEIAVTGSPEELKLRYGVDKTKVLISGQNGIEEYFINTNGSADATRISEWMKAGVVKSIHSCEPTLAEIFVKVTGRDLV